MCPDLQGNQNQPSRARRERTPRATLYPGRALFWGPHEVLGGILVCVLGSFGPSPLGELSGRVSIRHPGPNRVGASGDGRARSRRKVLRLYRHPTAEARSPPARSARFPHPVQVSQRGVRAAAVKACLVIYNDEFGCVANFHNLQNMSAYAARRPLHPRPPPPPAASDAGGWSAPPWQRSLCCGLPLDRQCT